MKKNFIVACALVSLIGTGAAQQVASQSNASVSSNTSVSTGQSGANVQSDTNARTSNQTSIAPAHEHSTKKHEHPSKNAAMTTSGALSGGTTVNAVLAKPVDSRKCKPGDQVVATASEDVKSDGKVVIRKGSKLIGHVTEVKAKGEGEANSSLGLMFDRAVLKSGEAVQMNSTIQALAAGHSNAPEMDDDMAGVGGGTVHSAGSVRGGGGLLGGVSSTASGATGAVANAGGNATGALNSSLGSTATVGNGVGAALNSNSTGVVGLKGLSLAGSASNATQGSVITSTGKSVHLDSGTQMVLRVVN